uniref:FHA domain-containing protein FhaB/FipA n=1 Tax=Aquiluna sp. TaxID=2053504 RepID=UPI0040483C8C
MSELALFLVRIGFVAVLWVFILSLLSVIRADLYGRRVISRIAKQNAPSLSSGAASELGIEDADSFEPSQIAILTGRNAGSSLSIDGKKEILIGRAATSDLVIGDEFASSLHAKLVLVGEDWVLQDLNSTNGTFLDGKKVTTPATVRAGMNIRIGTTNFELRA